MTKRAGITAFMVIFTTHYGWANWMGEGCVRIQACPAELWQGQWREEVKWFALFVFCGREMA